MLEFGHRRKGKSPSRFTSADDQLKLSFSTAKNLCCHLLPRALFEASWKPAGCQEGSRQWYFSLPPLSPLIYLCGSTAISHTCVSGPALFNLVATRPLSSSVPLTNCSGVPLGFLKLTTIAHTTPGRAPPVPRLLASSESNGTAAAGLVQPSRDSRVLQTYQRYLQSD